MANEGGGLMLTSADLRLFRSLLRHAELYIGRVQCPSTERVKVYNAYRMLKVSEVPRLRRKVEGWDNVMKQIKDGKKDAMDRH